MLILQPSCITAVILGREAADVFVVLCGFVFRRHNVWLSRQRSLPQPLVFNDMSWSAQYRQQRGTGLFQNETESHLRLLFFPPPPFWQQGAATLSKGHSESDLCVFSHLSLSSKSSLSPWASFSFYRNDRNGRVMKTLPEHLNALPFPPPP